MKINLKALIDSILVFILMLILCTTLSAESTKPITVTDNVLKKINPCLSAGVKKSVIFLGRMNPKNEPEFSGTAFLIDMENIHYLVTAKHVVEEFRNTFGSDNALAFYYNLKNQKYSYNLFSNLKKKHDVDWVFASNSDIAVIPFGISKEFDVKTIPESFFLTSDKILELQDTFFISYQPGIKSKDKIAPIIRSGMISIFNEDGTFYLDAFAFPGNSGSPVFIKPSAFIFTQKGVSAGDPEACKFIGIIGEYLTYQEIAISAQTRRPRIVFEENTGLARVWPVQALIDLFNSPGFIKQHEKLKLSIKVK